MNTGDALRTCGLALALQILGGPAESRGQTVTTPNATLPSSSGSLAAKEATPGLSISFARGRPLAESLNRAGNEKKPVMVDVFAAWCGPCKKMDGMTYSDSTVGAWARESVVPAKIDAEVGEGWKIVRRYQVFSYPTVLFLDSSGNEIDRLLGGFPPAEFLVAAKSILDGKSPLLSGPSKLKANWDHAPALQIGAELARRNDWARLQPIALRLLAEEPKLSGSETLKLFADLVDIEEDQRSLTSEIVDLIASLLPRLGNDPRRASLAAVYVETLGQRGDLARARDVAAETLRAFSEGSPHMDEVLAALSGAEQRAGHMAEAYDAAVRASSSAEGNGAAPRVRAIRFLDLAETAAAAGRTADAKRALASALVAWASPDPATLIRAAHAALAIGQPSEAMKFASDAVLRMKGDDDAAQAALTAARSALAAAQQTAHQGRETHPAVAQGRQRAAAVAEEDDDDEDITQQAFESLGRSLGQIGAAVAQYQMAKRDTAQAVPASRYRSVADLSAPSRPPMYRTAGVQPMLAAVASQDSRPFQPKGYAAPVVPQPTRTPTSQESNATYCLSLKVKDTRTFLVNRCNQKLEVFWCYANSDKGYPCRGLHGGSWTLGASESYPLIDLEANVLVEYAGCVSPRMPANYTFDGSKLHFECK